MDDDDEEEGPWPGEREWIYFSAPGTHVPEVDWWEPEAIGIIELPDGTEIEVFEDKPAFGFGRWLHG